MHHDCHTIIIIVVDISFNIVIMLTTCARCAFLQILLVRNNKKCKKLQIIHFKQR